MLEPENGAEIAEAISERAVSAAFPDGQAYRSLAPSSVQELCGRFHRAGWELEAAALDAGIIPERYARNFRTFDPADQARLLRSRVAVVGLGGLGGTVVEILAREGVGRLTLIDGDNFEASNLNRQLFSLPELLDTPKAAGAAHRVARVNPSVEASVHPIFLATVNAEALLAGADLVVDCLDNLPARFVLESAARDTGIPLVSAAIGGVAGHVTTIFPEDEGLRLIYGPPESAGKKGAEQSLGTLPHAITVLSALEASEAIKILCSGKPDLRNRLLLMDLADTTFQVLELA